MPKVPSRTLAAGGVYHCTRPVLRSLQHPGTPSAALSDCTVPISSMMPVNMARRGVVFAVSVHAFMCICHSDWRQTSSVTSTGTFFLAHLAVGCWGTRHDGDHLYPVGTQHQAAEEGKRGGRVPRSWRHTSQGDRDRVALLHGPLQLCGCGLARLTCVMCRARGPPQSPSPPRAAHAAALRACLCQPTPPPPILPNTSTSKHGRPDFAGAVVEIVSEGVEPLTPGATSVQKEGWALKQGEGKTDQRNTQHASRAPPKRSAAMLSPPPPASRF